VPASYVPIVAIHSLGGSRANRHHMPNLQSGVAQPTQDEDPQATSNSLEWLLALPREISPRTPHKSPGDSHEQSPTLDNAALLFQAI
jgi:hypothetical protein